MLVVEQTVNTAPNAAPQTSERNQTLHNFRHTVSTAEVEDAWMVVEAMSTAGTCSLSIMHDHTHNMARRTRPGEGGRA